MKSAKTSSPMQMNYNSPMKAAGIVKLGLKAFNKAKKFFKGNKKIDYAKEPTYYNKKTRSFQSTKPEKVSSNPFTDPNKAKKTYISDNYDMRTDYTNEFIKKGDLKVK